MLQLLINYCIFLKHGTLTKSLLPLDSFVPSGLLDIHLQGVRKPLTPSFYLEIPSTSKKLLFDEEKKVNILKVLRTFFQGANFSLSVICSPQFITSWPFFEALLSYKMIFYTSVFHKKQHLFSKHRYEFPSNSLKINKTKCRV